METLDIRRLGMRLVAALVLGSGAWIDAQSDLDRVLVWLAGAGGGYCASRLFTWLRSESERSGLAKNNWNSPSVLRRMIARASGYLFLSPKLAPLTVCLLGAGISGSAVLALELVRGGSLNQGAAALVAFLVSQGVYLHARDTLRPAVIGVDGDR